MSTSCIWTFTGMGGPAYPPLDCIWFWIELTEFIPLLKTSPDPTWAVWTKFVGSPIMLRSIRRRLFGWGCSAMQQLKHNQNSLMIYSPPFKWSFRGTESNVGKSTCPSLVLCNVEKAKFFLIYPNGRNSDGCRPAGPCWNLHPGLL